MITDETWKVNNDLVIKNNLSGIIKTINSNTNILQEKLNSGSSAEKLETFRFEDLEEEVLSEEEELSEGEDSERKE